MSSLKLGSIFFSNMLFQYTLRSVVVQCYQENSVQCRLKWGLMYNGVGDSRGSSLNRGKDHLFLVVLSLR